MGDAEIFSVLTVILFILGSMMPVVHSFATGEGSDNQVENTEGMIVDANVIGWRNTFDSLAKAFFWYYGELPFLLNMIKIIMNIIWLYLLIRILPFFG